MNEIATSITESMKLQHIQVKKPAMLLDKLPYSE